MSTITTPLSTPGLTTVVDPLTLPPDQASLYADDGAGITELRDGSVGVKVPSDGFIDEGIDTSFDDSHLGTLDSGYSETRYGDRDPSSALHVVSGESDGSSLQPGDVLDIPEDDLDMKLGTTDTPTKDFATSPSLTPQLMTSVPALSSIATPPLSGDDRGRSNRLDAITETTEDYTSLPTTRIAEEEEDKLIEDPNAATNAIMAAEDRSAAEVARTPTAEVLVEPGEFNDELTEYNGQGLEDDSIYDSRDPITLGTCFCNSPCGLI